MVGLLTFLLLLGCTEEGSAVVPPETDEDPVDTVPPEPPAEDPPAEETDLPVETDPPAETEPPPPPETAADCFSGIWGAAPPVDYDQFHPVMGTHCFGTNHQDIQGVQRVVFVGDSITVGTLPTTTPDWYRNRLADTFVRRWGLRPPAWGWRNADPINGEVFERESGDFASCAKYGARTDDLLMDPHRQLETCIPEDKRALTTLVVMTIGGNDIYSLLEDVGANVDETTLRETYARATRLLREAIVWLKEPGRFPNGVYVVFANTYDFTDHDGAMDMATCEGAQLIGMDRPLTDPVLQDILATAQEEHLSIAVDTQTDMIFLGETFCGHGYNAADPSSRCYRGPGADLWLDFTCEHPNAGGHDAIRDMVMAVIDE